MNLANSLENRTVSSYPISISTSLALESLFDPRMPPYDPDRIVPDKILLSDYTSAYFNLFTLYRNLSTSMDRETFFKTSADKIADALMLEIEIIGSLFSIEGQNLVTPVFYIMSYKDVYRQANAKKYKIRPDRTEFQKEFAAKYMKIGSIISKTLDIDISDSSIRPERGTVALILTHVPYDLLSYTSFNKLDLLESNTGKLKTRRTWNTKYLAVGGAKPTTLPFIKKLLLIFGDKVMFSPTDIRLRRLLLEIADVRKWTPATTTEKVLLDTSLDLKDKYLVDFIKNL